MNFKFDNFIYETNCLDSDYFYVESLKTIGVFEGV